MVAGKGTTSVLLVELPKTILDMDTLTLEALNIDPGMFCYKFNEQMTKKVNQDKIRKSTSCEVQTLKISNSCK
jgi:hypothetical protein